MTSVLAALALSAGVFLAVFNWYAFYASARSDRQVSPVPLLGGLLLFFGLIGFEQTRSYAWLGIATDFGTLMLVYAIPSVCWEVWTTSSANLVHRFVSEAQGRRDDIKLFQRAKFTIETVYDPPVPAGDHGAFAVSLRRTGSWRREAAEFVLDGYGEDRILRIRKHGDGFRTEELNYPDRQADQADRLDSLDLKRIE